MAACDFGRLGGGGRPPGDGDADTGVVGGIAGSVSFGTRFDLARGTDLVGGDVRSIADAGRTGGPAIAGENAALDRPGEAV